MVKKVRRVPSQFCNNYADYREDLRIDCDYSCVYCELTENEIGGANSFEIDHYAPFSRFSMLKCVYQNLLYSCNICNRTKSSYWPSKNQREKGEYFLSPFRHDLDLHIDKLQPKWSPLSPEGTWNIRKLNLASNTLNRIRERRSLASLGQNTEDVIAALTTLLTARGQIPHELQKQIDVCIKIGKLCNELKDKRLDSRKS